MTKKRGTTRETRRREEKKRGRMDLPYVLLGFSRVPEEELDFGGAEVLGINLHKDMLPTRRAARGNNKGKKRAVRRV